MRTPSVTGHFIFSISKSISRIIAGICSLISLSTKDVPGSIAVLAVGIIITELLGIFEELA